MLRGQLFADFAGRRNVWHEKRQTETETKTKSKHETTTKSRNPRQVTCDYASIYYLAAFRILNVIVCEEKSARPIGDNRFFFWLGGDRGDTVSTHQSLY